MPGKAKAVTQRIDHRSGEGSEVVLSRGVVVLFAVACGAAVANVYLSQPLLVTMGHDLAMSPALVGSVVTFTQVGYGLGLFFLVPLGDVADRRRLIVAQLLLLVAALAVVAAAHTAAILLAGMAAVGVLAVVTQALVAFAASLASPAERGRVVGLVTSGVVIGILLARTVSGLLADLAGWRSVYLVSASLTALLALVLYRVLPHHSDAPPTSLRYRQLLRSTITLFATERLLRLRALFGLLIFAAFSTLWSSIALPLSEAPYFLSHSAIGALGLIGVVGALAATAAGRLNDRGLSRRTTGIALALLTASWLPLSFTRDSLWALIVGGDPSRPRRAGGPRHQPDPDLRAAPGRGQPTDRRIHGLLLDRQRHRRHCRDLPLHAGRLGRGMRTGLGVQLSRARAVGLHSTHRPGPRCRGRLSRQRPACHQVSDAAST